jgi:hypothetical protein
LKICNLLAVRMHIGTIPHNYETKSDLSMPRHCCKNIVNVRLEISHTDGGYHISGDSISAGRHLRCGHCSDVCVMEGIPSYAQTSLKRKQPRAMFRCALNTAKQHKSSPHHSLNLSHLSLIKINSDQATVPATLLLMCDRSMASAPK